MKYLFAAILALVLFACGSRPGPAEEGAVLSIGDRSLFDEDLRANLEVHRGDSQAISILRDNILARELFIAHAMAVGIPEDPEALRLVHERRREILQRAWIEDQMSRVDLPSGAARDFWEELGTGVGYTALTLRDTVLMDSIAALVHNGEDLAELAGTFGMESMTRTTRGNIVLSDRLYANLMDLEYLEEPVPGTVIGPFPVRVGQRILRIDSIWSYEPELSFQADSQRIANLMHARLREQRKIFVEDSIKTARNIEFNPEAMELMASRGNGYGFEEFSSEEEGMWTVAWNGGTRDLFSVNRNIQGLPPQLPRATSDLNWLYEYAERLAMFDIEMELAIEAGLDTLPDYSHQLMVKELETYLDVYYEQIIEPRINPEAALLDSLYQEIKELHPIPETRVFQVLFLSSPDRIDAATTMMASGGDLIEHADEFQPFPPVLAEGEDYLSRPLSATMVPETDRETLFSLEYEEETVVALSDSTALWLRLQQVEPERIPEFEEIRDRVVSEAERTLETRIIQGLVDSLEASYHPYIDDEYFQEFYNAAEADSLSGSGDSEEVTDAL